MRTWSVILSLLFFGMAISVGADDPAYWSWIILGNIWSGVGLVLRALAHRSGGE